MGCSIIVQGALLLVVPSVSAVGNAHIRFNAVF